MAQANIICRPRRTLIRGAVDPPGGISLGRSGWSIRANVNAAYEDRIFSSSSSLSDNPAISASRWGHVAAGLLAGTSPSARGNRNPRPRPKKAAAARRAGRTRPRPAACACRRASDPHRREPARRRPATPRRPRQFFPQLRAPPPPPLRRTRLSYHTYARNGRRGTRRRAGSFPLGLRRRRRRRRLLV